jgi:hypothetical protein
LLDRNIIVTPYYMETTRTVSQERVHGELEYNGGESAEVQMAGKSKPAKSAWLGFSRGKVGCDLTGFRQGQVAGVKL